MKKTTIIIFLIILLSFIAGIILYPKMPAQMPAHWNIRGEVDNYFSKFWGLFLMPLVSLGLFLLFLLIPRIDPLKKNIEKFRKYFDGFVLIIILFLLYIYTLTIFWSFGFKFDMSRFMFPALAVLFYYIGIFLEKTKRNWFIGIRTPWTLSSDIVWEKTNNLGAKLFKISGIIILLSIFLPQYTIFFVLIPILLFSAFLIIYSYFEYRKIK